MRFLCWVRTIWRTFWWPQGGTLADGQFTYCSGHNMVNEEEDIEAYVTTSKCEDCGKYEVLWKRR